MVFSIDTVKQSLNKPIPATVTVENSYDSSFFGITLEMMIEEQREFETNMININEGLMGQLAAKAAKRQIDKVKSVDFKELLSKIFDWFISAIEKVQQIFAVGLAKMINKETRIKMFKNKLANFEGEIRYNKKYYDYTNILVDSSYATYQTEISKEYDELIQRLTELKSSNTPMDLADALSSIKNDIEYTSEDLDELRGKILGLNKTVESGEFANALFKYFRNDRSEPHNPGLGFSEKNLTSTDVMEAYNNYFAYNKQEKIIDRESRKLKGQALVQKAKVKTINISSYIPDSSKLTLDCVKEYNNIVNIKCRKIKDICDIYRMFYSAKLDALKEYNIKNRDILLAAIDEIVKKETEINVNK